MNRYKYKDTYKKVGDFELVNGSTSEPDIQISNKKITILAIRCDLDDMYYVHRWMYNRSMLSSNIDIELEQTKDKSYINHVVCKLVGIDEI